MPLPKKERFTAPSTTEGEFKQAQNELIDYLAVEVPNSEQVQEKIYSSLTSIEQSSRPNNLFEFEDEKGKTIVRIGLDGDIQNPSYSLNKVGDDGEINKAFINELKNNVDLIALESVSESSASILFEFSDNEGKTAVAIEGDGDIKFSGGRSLKKELMKSSVYKTPLIIKDQVSDDFSKHLLNGFFWNGISRSNIFVGAVKQNYEISSEDDFLALKVSQSNPLLISTPYLKAENTISPQSQVVHPFICEFKDKPFGYKYILLATPFHHTNDQLENPTVWGSQDLQNFELLNQFDQPLAEALPIERGNYNSDNFAVYDHTTGEFCVFYRNTILTVDGTAVDTNRLYVRKTLDFINWSKPEMIMKHDGVPMSSMMLSPSIIFNPILNKWQMHHVDWGIGDVGGAVGDVAGYSYRTSDYLTHGWSELYQITTPSNIECWHQETRYCGNHFICIMSDIYSNSNAINGKGNIYIGISSDGMNFNFSESVFSGDFNNPYKASISPELTEDGVKFHIVWTSNGNYQDGWKLYSSETLSIGVL